VRGGGAVRPGAVPRPGPRGEGAAGRPHLAQQLLGQVGRAGAEERAGLAEGGHDGTAALRERHGRNPRSCKPSTREAATDGCDARGALSSFTPQLFQFQNSPQWTYGSVPSHAQHGEHSTAVSGAGISPWRSHPDTALPRNN